MQVQELFIYPVKSCAGIRLESAELTPTGLKHDREFVIARPNGMFVTQRLFPRMALIQPTFDGEVLTLNAPEMEEFRIVKDASRHISNVTVWDSIVLAADQGDEAAAWLTAYLGVELRLFGMCDETHRPIDPNFAHSPADVVSFADGYAMLVISQASLDHLNEKVDFPVGMDRFRPNIVVSDATPHAEDRWKSLYIRDIPMSGVKPCARCAIVTVDQQTGVMGKEPNRTLATYRRFPRGVMFGMNLIHHATGEIRVGDSVCVEALHSADWINSIDYRK